MMDDDEFVELLWENDQPLIQQDQPKRARRGSSPTAPLPTLSQFKDDDEIATWDNYLTHLSYCSNIYTIDQYLEPDRVSTPKLSLPLSAISVPISSKTNQGFSEALLQSKLQMQDAAWVEQSPLSSSKMGVVKIPHYARPLPVARATKHSISGMRSGKPASTSASVCGGASSNLKIPVITEAGDPEFKGKKKGRGPKRTRAANVHNLSQRRRRARINEKITALQELIPNCNKVDKASILEEAIEYLKTLQLQLQMMYMRIRPFNPLIMPPAGMQLPQMPTMPPFSPMETGIVMGRGTGFSYGMGMYDSSNVQHFPVPPMNEQFTPRLMGIQVSNGFPIYGMHGQGLSVPMHMPMPVFPPSELLSPDKSKYLSSEISRPTTMLATSDVTLYLSSKNQHHQRTDIESTEKGSTK